MSLVKGSGMGCYAKSATLAELVRTDMANFSKSLSRLIKHGYVLREAQQGDKRMRIALSKRTTDYSSSLR